MTISGDVRNKLSIINRNCIGTAVLPTDSHVWWAYFLAVIETVYKSWDLHSLLVAGCPLTWYEWNLFKSAVFHEGFSTLKMQRTFHYRPKYVIFSPVKIPFFSNRRALWIKLNKFTIKNLTCNDVTTVYICYVLLILHLYFLSCPYSSWTNANCLASCFYICLKQWTRKKNIVIIRVAISVSFKHYL